MTQSLSRELAKGQWLLVGCLFLSVAWTTGPDLWRDVGQSAGMARLPYSEKRVRVMGPFYAAVKRLDRVLPPNERLAIIFADLDSAFPAAFASHYLYPRDTRSYYRLAPWRNDPNHPLILALADVSDPEQIRQLDYLEIRRRLHLQTPITAGLEPASEPSNHFMIPLAGSLDGPGEDDVYTVEGILESSRECEVTLTFFPLGLRKTYSLEGGKPLRFVDLVGEGFGRMDLGWLEVSATTPVRTAFRYVDRGRKQVEPLPVVEHWPAPPILVEGAGRIFVINASDHPVEVNVNGTTHLIAARGVPAFPALPLNQVSASELVFAFTTRRDARGRTFFGWPRQTR